MKKINLLLLVFVLLMSLSGCNNVRADMPSGSEDGSAAYQSQDANAEYQSEVSGNITVSDTDEITNSSDKSPLDEAIRAAILNENVGDYLPGECQGVGYKIIETFEEDGVLSIYALTQYLEYGFQDGVLVNLSGTNPKVLMKFKQTGSGSYELIFYTRLDLFSDLSEEEIEKLLEPLNKSGKSYVYSDEDIQKIRAQADEDARAYLKSIGRAAEVGVRSEHEGKLLTDLVPDAELLMELAKDETYSCYPEWTGTQERIENGVRYVYRTEYDESLKQIVLTKTLFDTDEAVEQWVVVLPE